MRGPLRIAVPPTEDINVARDCLTSFRRGNLDECQHTLTVSDSFEAVRVLQEVDAQLQTTDGPLDFTLDSNIVNTLLNGSADTVLTQFYITAERFEAGLRFSNPLSFSTYGMLHRSESSRPDWSMNTKILTNQLPKTVMMIIASFMFVTMLIYIFLRVRQRGYVNIRLIGECIWEFARESLPGSNTRSFPTAAHQLPSFLLIVKTATILTMFYQLFYTAILAQSLMVTEEDDLEARPFEILQRLTDDQTVFFRSHGPVYEKVMESNDTFSELIRKQSINGEPTLEESVENSMNSVMRNGDVWMAPWSQLLTVASRFTEEDCYVFRVTPWPTLDLTWQALPFSSNMSFMKREYITALATWRTNFDTDMIETLKFKPGCKEHVFPQTQTQMNYYAIDLMRISGIFWIWLIVCGFATICFVAEVMMNKSGLSENDRELDETDETLNIWKFNVKNTRQKNLLNNLLNNIQLQLSRDNVSC